MVLTGLEMVLLGGIFTVSGGALGAVAHRIIASDRCTKCGIDGLRVEIKIQGYIQRRLAEKSGLSQEELIEIESLARQNSK